MAEVYSIPVIGVSSLDGLAYNVNIDSGIICSMIDSRNDNIYTALFDCHYQLISNYFAISIVELIQQLKSSTYKEITFVGNGALLHKDLLTRELSGYALTFSDNDTLNATNIGKCGFYKFKNGEVQNSDTLLPLYINKPQAERMLDLKNGNS